MVDVSRETYEKNGVETIVDGDGILWLNEKYRRMIIPGSDFMGHDS